MDAMVLAALKKWPNVPACTAWLALDARGDWYMRDARTQARGSFPASRGSRIEHTLLREFIERNYLADELGRWFFQNGPQRVYVELEAAPFVWRLMAAGAAPPRVHAHTGTAATANEAWLDETGRLFLACDAGFGIVHTQDMTVAAEAVEGGWWHPRQMPFDDMPAHFGFVRSPAAAGV